MAYKPLPIVGVDVDKLRLDLQNYRIPRCLSQRWG